MHLVLRFVIAMSNSIESTYTYSLLLGQLNAKKTLVNEEEQYRTADASSVEKRDIKELIAQAVQHQPLLQLDLKSRAEGALPFQEVDLEALLEIRTDGVRLADVINDAHLHTQNRYLQEVRPRQKEEERQQKDTDLRAVEADRLVYAKEETIEAVVQLSVAVGLPFIKMKRNDSKVAAGVIQKGSRINEFQT